jgi:hypothetical protein
MVKRFFELLGLVTMGVGLWLVITNEHQNHACDAIEGKYRGLGMSTQCSHIVYSYFSGFVLLALGVMVVIFGLLSTRKSKKRRTKSKPSTASTYVWKDPVTGKGPMS